MSGDIEGLYAALEVSASASAGEIKTAYRRLAKLHHPDHANTRDDAAIKRINAAYAVLGKPESRAEYDRACAQASREATDRASARATSGASANGASARSGSEWTSQARQEAIEPVRCSRCSKIPAQPRYLIFWRVYGFLLFSRRSPIQGFFCSACARSEAFKSSLLTGLFGWWSFPWGPIAAFCYGLLDAQGGVRNRDRDDVLAWQNALYFVQSGQLPLARAVAERLQRSRVAEVRQVAELFIAHCTAQGIEAPGQLRNTWRGTLRQIPLRLAAVFAPPAAVVSLAIVAIASRPPAPPPSYEAPSAYSAGTYAGAAQAYSEPMAQANPPVPAAETCNDLPPNGTLYQGYDNLATEGHHLTIDNGTAGIAIVKLRYSGTNTVYAAMYVARGQSATLNGIRDGSYTVQYAIGDALAKDCATLAGDFSAATFPDLETLQSRFIDDYRGQGTMYQSLTYTLYPVTNGNVRSATISSSAFNAP